MKQDDKTPHEKLIEMAAVVSHISTGLSKRIEGLPTIVKLTGAAAVPLVVLEDITKAMTVVLEALYENKIIDPDVVEKYRAEQESQQKAEAAGQTEEEEGDVCPDCGMNHDNPDFANMPPVMRALMEALVGRHMQHGESEGGLDDATAPPGTPVH